MSAAVSTATIRSGRRRLGRRAAAVAIGNEIEKGLLAAWGERLQIAIELPLFLGFFLLLVLILGRGQQIASGHLDWRFEPAHVSSLMVGYAAYLFIYLQSANLSGGYWARSRRGRWNRST